MRPNANAGWHCLPLLPIAILVTLNKYNFSNKNDSYYITSILCINYLSVSLVWKHVNYFYSFKHMVCLTLCSGIFAYFASKTLPFDHFVVLFIFGFLANLIFTLILTKLPIEYKSCFTIGELLIILQSSMSVLSTSFGCYVFQTFDLKYKSLFCSRFIPCRVMQIIWVGIALLTILCFKFERNQRQKLFPLMLSVVLLTYLSLYILLKIEPIAWLVNYVLVGKEQLILIWSLILIVTLVFCFVNVYLLSTRPTTVTRKLFHLSITFVYVIGLKYDQSFLYFASSAILAVFVLLELIRIINIPIIGPTLESVVQTFRDEKDQGILTLTHIYLLVGCSMPIWIFPYFTSHNLAISSGLITIGFGDTAASVFGYLFGKNYWSGTHKTIEGTFCAMIAQFLASLIIYNYLISSVYLITLYELVIITIACVIIALIEAKTTQIDNLTLPLYFYILMTFLL